MALPKIYCLFQRMDITPFVIFGIVTNDGNDDGGGSVHDDGDDDPFTSRRNRRSDDGGDDTGQRSADQWMTVR